MHRDRNNNVARVCVCAKIIIFFFLACSTGLTLQAKMPAQKISHKTADQGLISSDRRDRLEAIETIRGRSEMVAPEKIRAARDAERDPLLRHHLNQAMAESGVNGVDADLIQSLKNDSNAMVRQGAAQSLGNYVQNPNVIQALSDGLEKDGDLAVRCACALSLGNARGIKAQAALEKSMGDADADLRRQIAYSLKRQKSARSIALLKKMQNDADESVRLMAGAKQ